MYFISMRLWYRRAAFCRFENLACVFVTVFIEKCCKYICIWFWKNSIYYSTSFLSSLLLNKQTKETAWRRALFFCQLSRDSAVMGTCFYLLFNAYNGEVNKILMSAHIINRPINWLGKDHAMQTLIITAIWGGVGNYMVYFIAGIQQVSRGRN